MRLGFKQALCAAAVVLTMGSVADADVLKLGVMNAQTGPYAFGGVPLQNGMRLAIEQANANKLLGSHTIEMIEGDTAGDKGQTITLVSRYAQIDNVLMILGPTTSIEGTAGAPVANELKVPMFTSANSPAILAAGPYTWKFQPRGLDIMGYLADHVAGKLGLKKVVLIYDRANEGLVAQKDAFRDLLKAKGVEIVSEEGILASDTDFLALATKLANTDMDGFFIASASEVGANVVIQARQAGVPASTPCLGPSGFASDSFIATAGDAVEGCFMVADYFVGDPYEPNVAFVKAYEEKYKVRPDNWAGMGYAIATLGLEAIRLAGDNPDREKVKGAFHKLKNVPTIMGTHTFTTDDNRNPTYGAAVLTVDGGKFRLAN